MLDTSPSSFINQVSSWFCKETQCADFSVTCFHGLHFTEFDFASGIYYEKECSSEELDHGVLVVGYGFQGEDVDGKKYWIVKNRSVTAIESFKDMLKTGSDSWNSFSFSQCSLLKWDVLATSWPFVLPVVLQLEREMGRQRLHLHGQRQEEPLWNRNSSQLSSCLKFAQLHFV